jgi:hypothetical protein
VLLRKVHRDHKEHLQRGSKVILGLHLKVLRVAKEPKVSKEDLVQLDQHSKETEVQQDLWEPKDRKVLKVMPTLDQQVIQDQQDQPHQKVSKVLRVRKDSKEIRVSRVPLELVVTKVLRVTKVSKVTKVLRVI